MPDSKRFDLLFIGLLIAIIVFMIGMFATNADFRFVVLHPLSS